MLRSLGTRFLTVDLPHGLDDSIPEETSLENLKKQIQITDNGEEVRLFATILPGLLLNKLLILSLLVMSQIYFDLLRVNQGTVRVEPRLLPSRTYK